MGPILLFLPAHHETEILEAYAAGADDCVIKPISPAIFLAKVMAWAQRSWLLPMDSIRAVQTTSWNLDPRTRSLVHANGIRVGLTNLEFRLLNLLMSKPGQVFSNEELIRVVWGNYGHGDEVLLKNVVYRLRKKLELQRGRRQADADLARRILLQRQLRHRDRPAARTFWLPTIARGNLPMWVPSRASSWDF